MKRPTKGQAKALQVIADHGFVDFRTLQKAFTEGTIDVLWEQSWIEDRDRNGLICLSAEGAVALDKANGKYDQPKKE